MQKILVHTFLIFFFGSCLCAADKEEKPSTSLLLRKGFLEESYPVVGNLKPSHYSKISTQVSGRVKKVIVDVGSRVEKGDLLALVDPTFFSLDVKRQEALFALATINLEEAQNDYDRLRPLWEQKEPTIAKKSFDDACIRLQQKKALQQQALADLENAQKKLEETSIVAPYPGVVTKKSIEQGENVATTPPITLFEMMDDSSLIFEFSLPQDLLGKVHDQDRILLQLTENEDPFVGKIKTLFPHLEENSRSFRLQVSIPNDQKKYKAGQFVKGRLQLCSSKENLLLSKDALVKKGNDWFVMVKEGENFVTKKVVLGASNDREVEILQGLDAESLVIEANKNER